MTRMELPDKIPLESAPEQVKALLKHTLLAADSEIAQMTTYLADSEGKNLRAALLVTAAAQEDGFVPKNGVITAAAMELLHLASLVHDDVIDDAATRRGRASVKQLFGNKAAVICGDYLFCQCFLLLADISGPFQNRFQDVARAMTKICLGALREYRHNGNLSLNVRQYFKIVAGKTSALFALALYAGALIGGYGEKEARLLGRFGHDIGMVFQLTDDCIDYAAEESVAQKSVCLDLREGTVTLPLIFALGKMPALKDRIAPGLSQAEIKSIVSEVIALGGVSMTMDVADKYCTKAAKLLTQLPEGFRKDRLSGLLGQIQTRLY